MDAVKFLKARKKMCEAYKGCTGCPMEGQLCGGYISVDAERVVGAVEEWSAAHPGKTRQSVFLGNYPCARIDSQSVLYACPADVYGDNVCPRKKDAAPITCYECRREFWMQEVE